MDEYIERKKAVDAIADTMAKGFVEDRFIMPQELQELQNELEMIPAVDVAPVVHGRWIDKGWDGDFSWHIDGRGNCWKVISCSVCDGNLYGSNETDYCPHCGAKMDLSDGEK